MSASTTDTLATLRAAISPKTGMQRIPFPTESYQHPSKPLSAKRLLNLFAAKAPPDSRSEIVLESSPGTVFRETLQVGGQVHAFNTDLVGGFYAVSGDHAFRNSDGVTVDLGFVGTSSDVFLPSQIGPTIAVSPTVVVICVPPRAYTAAHDGALNEIGGTFPGADSVTFIDGYFIFTQVNRGTTWFISKIDDPTMFDALDFANLEGHTNILYRAIAEKNELWLGGASGWEVWYDSGNADFPFRRRSGGIIPYGLATPLSIGQIDGSVFWVCDDGNAYRSAGYTGQVVSTEAIAALIRLANPESTRGLTYMQDGHAFYCVELGDRTVCYDCATKQWHDRSSSIDGTGPWLAKVAGRIGPGTYIGDALGRLYNLSLDADSDNGVLVPRQFTMPGLWAGTSRGFCNRVEIEMEVGTDASHGDVLLDWSDDGGYNFRAPRVLSAGGLGDLGVRLYTTRLGSFHKRTFRVTAHGRPRFYGVDADITAPPNTSGG